MVKKQKGATFAKSRGDPCGRPKHTKWARKHTAGDRKDRPCSAAE